MKKYIVATVLTISTNLLAAEVINLVTAPPSDYGNSSRVLFKMDAEDVKKSFSSYPQQYTLQDNTQPSSKDSVLHKNGCTMYFKGAPSEQSLSSTVDSYFISNDHLSISLYGGPIEKIFCNFPVGKAPSLEKISAGFGNKLEFSLLREIEAPKASLAKKIVIKDEINLATGSEGTPYIYVIEGSTLASLGINDKNNRCVVIGNGTSKELKKLLPADELKTKKSTVGYMSVWGQDHIGMALYLTLVRTGDRFEINCLENRNLNFSLSEMLKKHFGDKVVEE